jgi:uncharacterized hydrophobic protein (TIGR00271 family)
MTIPMLKRFQISHEKESPETVINNIAQDAVFQGKNLWILIFAILIASLGLNINSTAVVIGAMLISPLMGPIMGIGLGVGINDLQLVKKAFKNYLLAVSIGLVTSSVYFALTPLSDAYSELLARTAPTIYDVLIALFGGFAGIVATSSKGKGNVIPGVAIATALIPPLCTAGYGLATLNVEYFFGAFYLFTINTVFIAIATLVTVKLLHFPLKHLQDERTEIHSRRIVIAITILTLIPSIYLGYQMVQQNRFIHKANLFIKVNSAIEGNYLLNKDIDYHGRKITLIYGGKNIPQSKINSMIEQISAFGLKEVTLTVKQGISTLDDVKESSRMVQVTQMLAEKERELMFLKGTMDSISSQHRLVQQIFKELEIQYPEIRYSTINQPLEYYDKTSNNVPLILIKVNRSLSVGQQKKLKEWLKTRLQSDRIDIKIIR